MKKLLVIVLAVVMVLTLGVSPVFAGIGSEIPDKGEHYNLNIIGVPHDKTADMKGSHRHTIFVPLDTTGRVPSYVKIYFERNIANPDKFQVLDGNATTDGVARVAVPFEDYGTLSFNVYATALGKPNGKAHVEAVVTFEEGTYGELLMTSFDLKRGKGKPHPKDISNIFRASGWIDVPTVTGEQGPEDITFENVWVFNVPTLLEYLWEYTNDGLKLMQVRFYPTTSGKWTNVP